MMMIMKTKKGYFVEETLIFSHFSNQIHSQVVEFYIE